QNGLESLNTKSVKSRCTVQKNRVLANDFFENVPNDRFLAFDHFAGLFDGCGVGVLFQLVVNERLKQFQRHLLRQTALMKLELRADNDNRASRIIDTFSKQILTETSLFALERTAQRFQLAIVRTAKHPAAAAVVE